jgi:hypothetical protein
MLLINILINRSLGRDAYYLTYDFIIQSDETSDIFSARADAEDRFIDITIIMVERSYVIKAGRCCKQ